MYRSLFATILILAIAHLLTGCGGGPPATPVVPQHLGATIDGAAFSADATDIGGVRTANGIDITGSSSDGRSIQISIPVSAAPGTLALDGTAAAASVTFSSTSGDPASDVTCDAVSGTGTLTITSTAGDVYEGTFAFQAKDDDTNRAAQVLAGSFKVRVTDEPEQPVAAGSASATIDGSQFSSTDAGFTTDDTLTIAADAADGRSLSIEVGIPSALPATYQIATDTMGACVDVPIAGNPDDTTAYDADAGSGSVVITKLTSSECAGTFSFTATDEDTGRKITVAKGVFAAQKTSTAVASAAATIRASDSYSNPPDYFQPGECTWYCFGRAYENGWHLQFKPGKKDAWQWWDRVKKASKHAAPKVGAIMVINKYGSSTSKTRWGHVAYVESISKDGKRWNVTHANSTWSHIVRKIHAYNIYEGKFEFVPGKPGYVRHSPSTDRVGMPLRGFLYQ